MKLHDPSGSKNTIDVEVNTKELETQILSKYKDDAKKIANEMQSKQVKKKDSLKGGNTDVE